LDLCSFGRSFEKALPRVSASMRVMSELGGPVSTWHRILEITKIVRLKMRRSPLCLPGAHHYADLISS
jgi:hypothetical protein